MLVREEGTVIEKRGAKVVVRLDRTARCGGCNACMFGPGGAMTAEAEDSLGAGVGDRVAIESRRPGEVRAGFVLFVLPLGAFVLGFLSASGAASGSEAAGLVGGLAAAALYFGVLAWRHRLQRRTGPGAMRVVRIDRPASSRLVHAGMDPPIPGA